MGEPLTLEGLIDLLGLLIGVFALGWSCGRSSNL